MVSWIGLLNPASERMGLNLGREGAMPDSRRSLSIIVTTVAVVSATLVAPMPASAAPTTYQVHVGAPLFLVPQAHRAPADGMRFYAPPLSVHTGDVITFVFEGFHTATLLPADTDSDAWVAANATGPDEPYAFAVPDPDEGPAGLKFNNNVVLPSSPDCGNALDPCPYSGSAVVNSGIVDADNLNAAPFRFSVRVDASAGNQVVVLCLIHLAMRLAISVVADSDPATTQAEIDAFAAQKVTRDARAADRLHRSLLEMSSQARGGVVQAYAGYDATHFALDRFYPRRIELRKGQRVQWNFDQLVFEDHTVTFPSKKAFEIAGNTFFPVCDPDGDAGALPDEPVNPDATTLDDLCPGGASQVELETDPRFAPHAGDGVVTSRRDFENSGIEGANVGVNDAHTLRFSKRSDVPYTFICMIHPFMQGKVVVR